MSFGQDRERARTKQGCSMPASPKIQTAYKVHPRMVDDPDFTDFSAAFLEESIVHHDGDGIKVAVTERAGDVRRLAGIHEFVDRISKYPAAIGYHPPKKNDGIHIGHDTFLGKHALSLIQRAQFKPVEGVRYSENIELFVRACEELGFPLACKSMDQFVASWMNDDASLQRFEGKRVGEAINELITVIREGLKSPKYRQRKVDRKIQSERNFNAACEYIDAHFVKKKRLLVVRVDLHFKKEELPTLTYAQMAEYAQRFLNNFRHTHYGSKRLGYIRKFEDGHSRGPHIHLLLLLDASEHQSHAYIAEQVGKYWERVTGEKGYYFSCHRVEKAYYYPALGTIERDDLQKRQNLFNVIRYMTKSDQFMKIDGFRCFGKGAMPDLSTPKLGRPAKGDDSSPKAQKKR